jgi:hypothetical protein
VAFNGFVALFGFELGYFLGFLFKWSFWCLLIPLLVVGPDGLRMMFRPVDPPVGRPQWVGWTLLGLPLLLAYGYAFPRVLPHATVAIVLLSAWIAVVNGTLEEVFWRGTYVQVFPRHLLWGYLYPSLGFGLWHIAPQSVFDQCPSRWDALVRGHCDGLRSLLGLGGLPHRLDPLGRRLPRAPRLYGSGGAGLFPLSVDVGVLARRFCRGIGIVLIRVLLLHPRLQQIGCHPARYRRSASRRRDLAEANGGTLTVESSAG